MSDSKEIIMKELIKNNISLQQKTADLIIGVSKLTRRMDKMVALFEEASQEVKGGLDEPLQRKIEILLEQNKHIARGLLLLEKYVREKTTFGINAPPKPM